MNRFASSAAASFVAWPIAHYISSARDRLLPHAAALSQSAQQQLRPYFSSVNLNRARIVLSDPLPIPDPPFYTQAHRLGFEYLRLAEAAAITLDYVIASRQPMDLALLFHELVNVVQFRLLGVPKFARLYARGFLVSGSYFGIPLERCAFELAHRFTSQAKPFNVPSEVTAWLEHDLL